MFRLALSDPIISNSFPVRYYGISGTNFADVPYSVPESRVTYGIPHVLEFGQATILINCCLPLLTVPGVGCVLL